MALDVDLDLILARVREAELVARLDAIAGSAPYAGAAHTTLRARPAAAAAVAGSAPYAGAAARNERK
jgi:hypothetical protein